ncbi:MAG: hypothetical protein LCH77_01060 [Actinobacteria bacterium]|nr:hypothetical protein [Actinomycetota bacterium]
MLGDWFLKAYLAHPRLPVWQCGCWFCYGRDLTWIPAYHQPKTPAFQHSIAAIADLGVQLRASLTRMNPIQAWDQMVIAAQLAHHALTSPSRRPWIPQDFLGHWHHASAGLPVC